MFDECAVHVDVPGRGAVPVGTLHSHRRHGRESATFRYAPSWLADAGGYALDPRLPLFEGSFHTNESQALFAAFTDAAPDRWGRRLIERSERHRTENRGEAARSFGEFDVLVGVRDDVRQGAIRCVDPATATYLAPDGGGVPALLEMPSLLGAVHRIERDAEEAADLLLLLRAGSSLGGARPKAHVIDADGQLSIAKFPSSVADEWDVMAWEQVALELARRAGIRTPASQLHRVDGKHVLVVRRFDRLGLDRVGYVSAMTLLEARDGDVRSYLEIADVISEHSPAAGRDLEELWRRIAFSILISNSDDHLRNHGFLRDGNGWSLSPVFDVNPNPAAAGALLSTAIDEGDTSADLERLLDVANYFRLTRDRARAVLSDVLSATSSWRAVAHAAGLSKAQQARMAPAFERDEADVARGIITAS
ncbi:MAG: type II toxin-antitoxin system HipA family toxin [Thermoleophilia bacterium]|nr:type II toxin-antitoxin system HipA family toxin [Thermoleophilia bacterium]